MKKFMKIGGLLVVVAVFIFSAVKIVSKLTTEREEQEASEPRLQRPQRGPGGA